MKKLLLSILLLLSFSGSVFAGTCGVGGAVGTAPWTADSTSLADVQYCIDMASVGANPDDPETVTVPSGSVEWGGTLTISKGVRLVGTSTVVTAADIGAGYYLLYFHPSVPSTDPIVDISGFTFDGGSGGGTSGQAGGLKISNTAGANNVTTRLRFHGNTIQHIKARGAAGLMGIYVTSGTSAYGLIDNNVFDDISSSAGGNSYIAKILGDDTPPNDIFAVQQTAGHGTDKFLFFENNLFTDNSYIFIDSGEGARYVVRFNTIDNTTYIPENMWNLHAPTGGNSGSMAGEIYNNLTIPTKYVPGYTRTAYIGAPVKIFNNETGFTNSAGITLYKNNTPCDLNAACTALDVPYNACTGSGTGNLVDMTENYSWNNTRTSTGANVAIVLVQDTNGCLVENTTYFDDYNETPSNLTTGLAAAIPESCTDNDVYFATDTIPNSNGGQGVLSKCTSNTWSTVYEPYICPNPLAGGGTCDYTVSGKGGYSLGEGPTYYTLTVSKAGDGSGLVTSAPTGINCSTDCTGEYIDGTSVVLTSTVDGSNQFDGWSGEGCSGTSTCTVTMSAARGVTATYTDTTPTNFLVTIIYAGSGTGTTSPAIAESPKAYASGATPTITQVAGSNSTFTGWSGTCSSCTGTGDCTPTITADCTVIPTWASDGQYSITIAYPYNGETIISEPSGLACGGDERDCYYDYWTGDIVFTTTCDTGWYGATWSGDDSGADPITIPLAAANIALVVSCTNGYGVTLGSGGLATLGSGGTATVYR